VSFAAYLRALLLVPSVLFVDPAAQAQEVELGPSLICNTEQQVERFIALYDGDTQAAVKAVNSEVQDPTACGVVNTAYVRGRQLATARNKEIAFGVVEILVLGIVDEEGSVESVTPAVFYSLFAIEEIEI
jgi:translation elongation factor EF-1beta